MDFCRNRHCLVAAVVNDEHADSVYDVLDVGSVRMVMVVDDECVA